MHRRNFLYMLLSSVTASSTSGQIVCWLESCKHGDCAPRYRRSETCVDLDIGDAWGSGPWASPRVGVQLVQQPVQPAEVFSDGFETGDASRWR